MDPLGFGRIISENWDILKMYPSAFWPVLGFGFVIGLAITRIFLNERLARQQMRIADLQAVLDGKLPPQLLPPPKRSMPMSFHLILGGLVFAVIGLTMIGIGIFWQSSPKKIEQANSLPSTGAPIHTTPEAPTFSGGGPPIVNSEEMQRQQLLKNRGALELAARDAAGIPVTIVFEQSSILPLKISQGGVDYSIGVSLANDSGCWIYGEMESSKKLYIAKSAQRGQPVDVRNLRQSKGSDTLTIGQRAFIELSDGRIAQLILVGVLYYRSGDDRDELRFKYKIYEPGEFLVDAL